MKRMVVFSFLASKRVASQVGVLALGTLALLGCPVYTGGGGGSSSVTCDSQGNCCDRSGNCAVWSCDYDNQCPEGASCIQSSSGGFCATGYSDAGYDFDGSTWGDDSGYGSDATTDCSQTGCQPGYQCTLTNGVAQCLPEEDGSFADAGADASEAGPGDAQAGDGSVDSTTDGTVGPSDGSVGDGALDADAAPAFTGCTSDDACVADAGAGARCLNGACVAAANQCYESSQCPATVGGVAEVCVGGVCTAACAGGDAGVCPTGYACVRGDAGAGVCSGNPTPCGAAVDGGGCATGTTCVDERCVPVCPGADAAVGDAGVCGDPGLTCVDNGCVVNQAPKFLCNSEGTQDTCATGSICLRHLCWISCAETGDAGDAGNPCAKADNFNSCNPVITGSSQVYQVCESTTDVGDECNPITSKACPDSYQICIDGYCY